MASGLRISLRPVIENFAERVQELATIEDLRQAWEQSVRDDAAADEASLAAMLSFPEPIPVGEVANLLGRADRALRFAARSIQTGRWVGELQSEGVRPVRVASGLVLVEVSPGSFNLRAAGERLDGFLAQRPVLYTLAAIAALGFVGLRPHLEFGDDAPDRREIDVRQHPPVGFFDAPSVLNAPEINIYLTVDGQRIHLRSQPKWPPSPRH
jgi:hypothetical protein